MFISPALAQTAATAPQPGTGPMGLIVQMVLLFVILWLFLIRPQQKRLRQHEAELKAIIRDTRIVVAGLIGRVVEVRGEDTLLVEFADGVRIPVLRSYVSRVMFDTPLTSRKEKK